MGEGFGRRNYLYEMLVSPANIYVGLGAGLLAVLLSFPLGLRGALLPLAVFTAGEVIAALFVPGLARFRAAVDRRYRLARRGRLRAHLIEELKSRLSRDGPEVENYRRMRRRLRSLRRLVADRRSSMTAEDMDRLEEATVDYLALLLARVLLRDRLNSLDEEDLRRRCEQLRQRLQQAVGTERYRLNKALEDLERLLDNRRRMISRRLALDSSLLALPETLEEIYQNLILNPANAADYLKMALDRLRLEAEVDHTVSAELAELERLHTISLTHVRETVP